MGCDFFSEEAGRSLTNELPLRWRCSVERAREMYVTGAAAATKCEKTTSEDDGCECT